MFSMQEDVILVTDSINESVNCILPLRRRRARASFVNSMHYWQTICAKENLTISELMSPCTNGYCNTYCLTQWHTSAPCTKTSNLFHIICPREGDVFTIEICSTAPFIGIRRWF